ncbi:glycoside hydrolase family 130 protein [Novosphingobium sp. JCM 18896]|uniref:glycoside hydrolase family 130 protein n=1 Tax=Novosphingobium sp. JCM 18896 TaxID=2989731 RepID=UPI0022221635|nr:glycoside hydrolase family 130 protein [Novosphingobium sp. JCM 18896]MCW1429773.1 glycoside hydrolase family 130 protein [Novosphingobium sp. JCM 18896]
MRLRAIKDDAEALPEPGSGSGLLNLHERKLVATPSRVVIRPFHLGWQASGHSSSRAGRLVSDILALSDEEVHAEYRAILSDFSERHWQTERVFDERAAEVSATLRLPKTLSLERSRLIGAYFCHEYSYQAAALMNPSVVVHPDQSGLTGGAVRFVMSMRAVGEGHISSIAFREGIVEPDGVFDLWPQPNVATAVSMLHDHAPEVADDVHVRRHPESTLSGSVIFPITEHQRGGLEDLRLVHFDNGDGTFEWVGTYTAYNGREIRSELMTTRDFRDFRLRPIEGRAGRNKGLALFPEKLGGSYYMIGRQDGKNLYLLSSDRIDRWDDDGVLLLEPKFPWEFIQIGNCGSPILTDHGWLVLTHGVGAMRKYSIGAILLDRNIPSKVLARSEKPILSPKDSDREGYVPNVVYTCGAMKVGETLFMPYGISDSAIGFATVGIEDLIASLG